MDHNIPKLVTEMHKLFGEFGSTLILEALANEVTASARRFDLSDDEKRRVIASDLQLYAETLTKLMLCDSKE